MNEAHGGAAWVVGTFDTKGEELGYLCERIRAQGVKVVGVDVSTSGRACSGAQISAREVASHHPDGADAVFTGERGSAVSAMAQALVLLLRGRSDVGGVIGGVIGAGGSGAAALVAPALRSLPVGCPKLLVCTLASGDVRAFVDSSDIFMLYPVVDISGLNRISRQVLANAAHAMAGMVRARLAPDVNALPCLGLSDVRRDDGHLAAMVDLTTTEIADLLCGSVLSAGEDRMGAATRRELPYVGSCGALDMIYFWGCASVPTELPGRSIHQHNDNVALVRTTPQDGERIGRWIAERLNRMRGPVRFLIPEGGVSALDAPGQPFWWPQADAALGDGAGRR